jgi:hypothetical protein
MKLLRNLLRLAADAAALPTACIARAQIYPSRPVRLIIGIVRDSGPDVTGRLLDSGSIDACSAERAGVVGLLKR